VQEDPPGWRLTSVDPETILEELRRDFSGVFRVRRPADLGNDRGRAAFRRRSTLPSSHGPA
jgi:hypothetical protein